MARRPLIERLPEIWSRLDKEGVLERYLGVWDTELDTVHDKITELLRMRSVDELPDRWLFLLGDLVGHRWRSDKSHDWNRRHIRDSIRRWSYKGTMGCLEDLVREHGGTEWSVKDMASTILILGRQGILGTGNAFIVAADYHHWGAFVLRVLDDIDIDAFQQDFDDIKAAGQVWYFEIVGGDLFVDEQMWIDSDIGACGDYWRGPLLGHDWPSEVGPMDGALVIAEQGYISGALLTVDLMIPVSEPDITVDQYYLTEAQALRQYSEETV